MWYYRVVRILEMQFTMWINYIVYESTSWYSEFPGGERGWERPSPISEEQHDAIDEAL